MPNLEYVLENETHKILCNFDIQIDHLRIRLSDSQKKMKEKRERAKKWNLLFRLITG